MRVDAASHDASLRQQESHFSLPRYHFSLTLLEGEVTSPYSSEVAWALFLLSVFVFIPSTLKLILQIRLFCSNVDILTAFLGFFHNNESTLKLHFVFFHSQSMKSIIHVDSLLSKRLAAKTSAFEWFKNDLKFNFNIPYGISSCISTSITWIAKDLEITPSFKGF